MINNQMESKREEIRKGPWKAEEDEVLINHVGKHGPREWSSIRSKGLLQRTGKSCRLRWVNKLRPNLKSGCKFTAEEERFVIELQSQFGNKWAKIATFLEGRTDNDVKNFWSSRQKRLARILQASATYPSSSNPNPKPHKANKQVSVGDFKCRNAPSMEEESSAICVTATQPLTANVIQVEPQPQLPFVGVSQPQAELVFSPESRQVLATLEDPYPLCVFEPHDTAQLPPFFDPASAEFHNPETPDIFFDDFPIDMFENIEHLPTP